MDNPRPVDILLIEDDEAEQKLLKRAFEQDKVLIKNLHIVYDGKEALDYLNDENKSLPDLILLDLNMPIMDGREFLEKIQSTKFAQIPIVVLTTSAQEEDILRSYNLGIKSYIIKPVDFKKFVDSLKILKEYWFEVVVLPPKIK